jgi:hypothetical protein
MINHSCQPNAVQSFEGSVIVFRYIAVNHARHASHEMAIYASKALQFQGNEW